MAKDRKGSPAQTNGKEEEQEEGELSHEGPSKRNHGRKSKRKKESETEEDEHYSEDEGKKRRRKKKKFSKRRSRRRYSDEDSYSSSSYSSDSESDGSDYSSEESESEDERNRRKRKRRKEREYEKEKRRIRREKEKERKRRKRDKEGKDKKKNKKTKTKTKKETTKGAVTDSWGEYGIIRETDMWNKRPEFTAWLAEVKQVNLEALSHWEEKQMFKEFMEDHNTATFPSKKYYSLDAYHKRKMEKEMKRGFKRGPETERTIFNDEEQRRQELQLAREKMKEEQVEALKHSMQSGLAQAMKEQAQLREEMAYQYKLGKFEAAAAIQRRLDPDVAM